MYAPVTLGALAARPSEPVRYSPMQPWHERHGAVGMVAGQWIRPEHYGDPVDEDHYLCSTTSSGAATVWEWAENWLQTAHPEWQVHITPVTTAYASINVAGPRSRELLGRLTDDLDLGDFGYMRVRTGTVAGVGDCVVWRIGFTGELSYELHVPAAYGLHVWEQLIEAGGDLGVRPFGVEAQRILRLEKGHAIVGQDTDGLTQGFSAGLDGLIKLDKPDFVGRPELVWQQQRGDHPRLVGLRPVDGSIVPPEASQVLDDTGAIAGRVTSSRHSPTLGAPSASGRSAPTSPASGPASPSGCPTVATSPSRSPSTSTSTRRGSGSVSEVRSEPVARSPIAPVALRVVGGREVSARVATGDLTMSDETPLAKVQVRAPFDGAVRRELGVGFGRTRATEIEPAGPVLLVGSGPGEWLALGGPGHGPSLAATLARGVEATGEFASVIDLTHGRALVRIEGRTATRVLAKVCGIDLSDALTPNGSALRTSVARVVTDLVRDDRGSTPSYLLAVERSSGQYLADPLLDAGTEFGLETTAFAGMPERAG